MDALSLQADDVQPLAGASLIRRSQNAFVDLDDLALAVCVSFNFADSGHRTVDDGCFGAETAEFVDSLD